MGWKNVMLGQGSQELKHAAAYMLLGQTEWILRRSETVTFTAEGSTRRHITFDCMLPDDPHKWLKWLPDNEAMQCWPYARRGDGDQDSPDSDREYQPKYVGLPVTFLGKGDLINLDVRDGEGNVLHTAGREDDASVLIHALENCLYELDSRDSLLYGSTFWHYRRCAICSETSPTVVLQEARKRDSTGIWRIWAAA